MARNDSPRVQNTLSGQWGLGTSSLNCLKLLIDWFCSETDYQIRSDHVRGGPPPDMIHNHQDQNVLTRGIV